MDIQKLTASIQSHEGTGPIKNGKFMPYSDSLGNLTQGWGHLVSDGISEAAARQILSDDIGLCVSQAQAAPWWPYLAGNDARERALTEMVYNLGVGGVGSFHVGLACLQASDFDGAANAFADSLWAKQVGARAQVICEMIRAGADST